MQTLPPHSPSPHHPRHTWKLFPQIFFPSTNLNIKHHNQWLEAESVKREWEHNRGEIKWQSREGPSLHRYWYLFSSTYLSRLVSTLHGHDFLNHGLDNTSCSVYAAHTSRWCWALSPTCEPLALRTPFGHLHFGFNFSPDLHAALTFCSLTDSMILAS